MGFSTDFVGHIDIEPPLNDSEIAYLLAFAASRRHDRGDPYEVPGNPRAELGDGPVDESYNRPPEGQPDLWCDWQVCWDGCCITWSGKEKSYAMEPWLRYVIDHFLRVRTLQRMHGSRTSRSITCSLAPSWDAGATTRSSLPSTCTTTR